MRFRAIRMIIPALLLASGAAHAESFTYRGSFGETDHVGGVGPEGRSGQGGIIEGPYRVEYLGGRVAEGTMRCVGMAGRETAGPFRLRLACDAQGADAASSMAFDCHALGPLGPDTALACTGDLLGKSGGVAGRSGAITMHWGAGGQVTGVGQWFE